MPELKFDITRIVEDVVEQLESKGFTYMKRGKWVNGKCTICGKSLEDLFTGEFYYDDNEINFCPNCGADMRNDSNLMKTEGKVLAVGLGGSFKDSLIKTEVEGLFLNFEQEG